MDCGECHESREGVGEVLIVLGETSVAAEPGEGPFDDPSARQHDETLDVVAALDDFDPEARLPGCGLVDLTGVVASVRPDELQPGKAFTNSVEDHGRAVTVLDPGGVNDHAQRQAQDVDERMQLAALYLLAGVITDRIRFIPARGPPFSAAFSD